MVVMAHWKGGRSVRGDQRSKSVALNHGYMDLWDQNVTGDYSTYEEATVKGTLCKYCL